MNPFLNIQPGKKYRTIMADPPWPVQVKANAYNCGGPDYPTMPIAEIASLPIRSLADKNCRLFLWVTNGFLEEALHMLRIWRFQYRMLYTWVKPYGMGRTPLVATEHCIIATIGQPPTPCCKGKAVLNWMKCKKQKRHSQKPNQIVKVFESFSQEPRIELFARDRKPGWDAWGSELPNQSTDENQTIQTARKVTDSSERSSQGKGTLSR